MRNMFALFVLAAALSVPAQAAPAPAAQTQPAAQPTVAAADQSTSPAAPLPAATLPPCGNYDGNACTTPGTKVRCQWIPYEPGICVCSSAHIWVCG